jgi:hypothetical protein
MNEGGNDQFHRDVYQEEEPEASGSYQLVSNTRIGQKPIAKTAKKPKV